MSNDLFKLAMLTNRMYGKFPKPQEYQDVIFDLLTNSELELHRNARSFQLELISRDLANYGIAYSKINLSSPYGTIKEEYIPWQRVNESQNPKLKLSQKLSEKQHQRRQQNQKLNESLSPKLKQSQLSTSVNEILRRQHSVDGYLNLLSVGTSAT